MRISQFANTYCKQQQANKKPEGARNKGIKRQHKAEKRQEAMTRQQVNIDRGYSIVDHVLGDLPSLGRTPAPLSKF